MRRVVATVVLALLLPAGFAAAYGASPARLSTTTETTGTTGTTTTGTTGTTTTEPPPELVRLSLDRTMAVGGIHTVTGTIEMSGPTDDSVHVTASSDAVSVPDQVDLGGDSNADFTIETFELELEEEDPPIDVDISATYRDRTLTVTLTVGCWMLDNDYEIWRPFGYPEYMPCGADQGPMDEEEEEARTPATRAQFVGPCGTSWFHMSDAKVPGTPTVRLRYGALSTRGAMIELDYWWNVTNGPLDWPYFDIDFPLSTSWARRADVNVNQGGPGFYSGRYWHITTTTQTICYTPILVSAALVGF